MKSKLIITVLALFLCGKVFAGDIAETLFFIGDDLETGLKYYNKRSDNFGDFSFLFNKNYNKNNLSYAKPDNYVWKQDQYEGRTVPSLVFVNTNNYAFLERVTLAGHADLTRMPQYGEDVYYLFIDGSKCLGERCILSEVIVSAIIPKKFKIYAYEGFENISGTLEYKEKANFKLIDNTLTLYAKNVKGASIKLWIQDMSGANAIYDDVSKSLSKFSEIKVLKTGTETKITMPMDNVFDSGKAVAKPQGKEWLAALASALSGKQFKEIRVEGHSDNVPIKGVFPSNWELSSARASDAVRYLISRGLDGNRIAAVGYSDMRPIADNKTAQDRAKNRRIEITVVGGSEDTAD